MLCEAIRKRLEAMNEGLVTAEAIGEALLAAGGEEAPPWVHVYQGQIACVKACFEALEQALHSEAREVPAHGQ